MKTCPKCLKYHNKLGKFCSRSCANSRIWSENDKLVKSIANKGKATTGKNRIPWNKGKTIKYNSKCATCNNNFLVYPQDKKIYCSRKCNPNVGGYRPGSGRSKSGYYKGIFCASTYELVWVIHRLDHNLSVKRFDGYLTNGKIKYFPDFIDGNTIIEIKGYHTALVDEKTNLAISKGYDIQVLYKKNLMTQFNWVKKNYKNSKLEELYDDYKAEYQYNCSFCGKKFFSSQRRITNSKFCTRKCAGRGHFGKKTKSNNLNRDAAGVATSPSN